MSQKGRISLSQSIALQAPSGLESQLAEARASVRADLEKALANADRESQSRKTLAQLAAPPSAARAMTGRQAREAKKAAFIEKQRLRALPPSKKEKTSATPTPERARKEPQGEGGGFDLVLHSGGQIRHDVKPWLNQFGDEHLRDAADHEAMRFMQRVWDIATRVRMTSNRAYFGMPHTGVGPNREGHIALSEEERHDLEKFAFAFQHLTAQDDHWWELLKVHHLREVGHLSDQRIPNMAELGAQLTAYKPKSENARTAGVAWLCAAARRWREAVQYGEREQQYARLRRQARGEVPPPVRVDERRLRLQALRKEIEDARTR